MTTAGREVAECVGFLEGAMILARGLDDPDVVDGNVESALERYRYQGVVSRCVCLHLKRSLLMFTGRS